MRLLLLLVFCLAIALGINSCKPECHDPANPKCENYDPCYGKEPVVAKIQMQHRLDPNGPPATRNLYVSENDIFPKAQINFSCPLANAKYTWLLGSETITSQQFERNFYSVPFDTYSVTLIVEKTPEKDCYPSDNGIDTFTQYFKIVPFCELQTLGIFKGVWENGSVDSAVVSIRTFDTQFNWTDSCSGQLIRFTNLQNKQDTLWASSSSCFLSDKEIVLHDPGHLGLANGNIKFNPKDKTVVMDYYIGQNRFIFNGRKIAP